MLTIKDNEGAIFRVLDDFDDGSPNFEKYSVN